MIRSRFFPVLACVLAFGLCTAGQASAVALKKGFYDCMAYDYATGFLDYKGSVKIKAKNRYEHSFGRHGRSLPKKTTGKFTRRGSLLTFKKGAMGGTKARLKQSTGADRQPFFELLLKGKPSGISCYFVTKP